MGKRGRPRTPTEVLKLRGSWRARVRQGEPQPEPGRPVCPTWVSAAGKSIWRKLIPMLDRMGVLTKIDGFMLVRYVEMYALWQVTIRDLNEHGPRWPQKDKNGVVVGYADRPEVSRLLRLSESLARIEARFGLSPSDRASLSVPPQEPKAPAGEETTANFLNLGTG